MLIHCASTYAIHLELTGDLGVNSFIQAFRRFSSRRGLPLILISDNAKTSKASSKEIVKIVKSQEVHVKIVKSQEVHVKIVKSQEVHVKIVKSQEVHVKIVKSQEVHVKIVKSQEVHVKIVK